MPMKYQTCEFSEMLCRESRRIFGSENPTLKELDSNLRIAPVSSKKALAYAYMYLLKIAYSSGLNEDLIREQAVELINEDIRNEFILEMQGKQRNSEQASGSSGEPCPTCGEIRDSRRGG